jgi:hypothetical protein
MIETRIHQPKAHAANAHAPAATCNRPAAYMFALLDCQLAAARKQKARVRVTKMRTKTMFVRRERIR